MPACFEIACSTGSYPVAVATGSLAAIAAREGEQVWMVDEFFAGHDALRGRDAITIAAIEPAKSLDRMTDIIVALRERRVTRATTLVALGGGVVQDVAAFAAAIYMRGLSWVYLPTTLLSMADSCIGGKSSINVGKYKNIVGTFNPPAEVVIDPALVMSQSVEQRAAGLCEAAKICMCRGPDCFARYLALDPTPQADADQLVPVIALSLEAKKWFIEIDEFDRRERLVLNFGHTFGHALEAASGFGVNHGIGVGLGMLAALHLGEALGRRYDRVPHVEALRAHVRALVGSVEGLPGVLAGVDTSAMLDAFRSDKKHGRDSFAVILVGEDGQVERRMLARDVATEALIVRAFARMIEDWTERPALPAAL